MSGPMNIGEAAAAAGVSTKMIRHYEQIGLVPAAARADSGYRQYSERDVSILRFIRQSRRLGFSMPRIADLLGLWSDRGRASREVKAIAQRHLQELEDKMRELAEMQRALAGLVASCHGDDDPHCAILDDLAARSPQAPLPGAVGSPPVRKGTARAQASRSPECDAGTSGAARSPRGTARTAKAPASATAPAPHADLMAWTRKVTGSQDSA